MHEAKPSVSVNPTLPARYINAKKSEIRPNPRIKNIRGSKSKTIPP